MAAIVQREVKIQTPGGLCDAVLLSPEGGGPRPGVLWWPDAYAVRPAMLEMAGRLAGEGYAVLVVNQFYRLRPSPVFPGGFDFSDPDARTELMKMIGGLTHEMVTSDGGAFIDFLDGQPEVSGAPMGSVGFCMGGSMVIRTAAARPGRVGAGVSMHGGRLVTDAETSPHRLVGSTRAAYHIAVAADDDEKDPAARPAMEAALDAAGLSYSQEVYAGARHGWTVTDLPMYDRPQAERAYAAMVALYARALA